MPLRTCKQPNHQQVIHVFAADGYLSEDERMHDAGGSDADSDADGPAATAISAADGSGGKRGKAVVVDFALRKAAHQQCQFDDATTAYFNALLAAKTQAQPLVICREPGARCAVLQLCCAALHLGAAPCAPLHQLCAKLPTTVTCAIGACSTVPHCAAAGTLLVCPQSCAPHISTCSRNLPDAVIARRPQL